MGLVIPQISPFIYSELKIKTPGYIFLIAQLALPLGTFITGYLSDKLLHVRYFSFTLTLVAGFSLMYLSGTDNSESDTLIPLYTWSLFMFAMGGIIPLINVSYLQNGFDPEIFGRVRLFGTLGFAIPNAVLLFIPMQPSQAIFWGSLFMLLSTNFIFFLPAGRNIADHEKEIISLHKVWQLLKAPPFLLFLLITATFFFSFSTAEYVISDFVANLNFAVKPVPFIWLGGTIIEIGVFFISPILIRKYGPLFLIGMGLFAGLLRYTLTVSFTAHWAIILSQLLHGIQFSGGYLGALLYLKKKTQSQRLGTAQALYTTFGRASGTGAGAYFLGNLAGTGAYNYVFFISIIVTIIGLTLLSYFNKMDKKFSYFHKK